MSRKEKISKASNLRPISNFFLNISDKGGKILLTLVLGLLGLYRWLSGKAEPDEVSFFTLLDTASQSLVAVIVLLFLFVLSLNEQLRKKSLNALTSQLRETRDQLNEFGDNIENLFNGFLRDHANKMGFNAATKARLSIYLNDDKKNYFYPCGRYSPDPEFQRKGRIKFAHGQGCIWKAWKNGFHFDSGAPKTLTAFRNYQVREYNIPQAELENLKMRPCLICGHRIEDPSGNPIGVIICEAVENNLFSEDEIGSVLSVASEELSKILGSLKAFVPNPNDAGDFGL